VVVVLVSVLDFDSVDLPRLCFAATCFSCVSVDVVDAPVESAEDVVVELAESEATFFPSSFTTVVFEESVSVDCVVEAEDCAKTVPQASSEVRMNRFI
jgi:hypothetical protein